MVTVGQFTHSNQTDAEKPTTKYGKYITISGSLLVIGSVVMRHPSATLQRPYIYRKQGDGLSDRMPPVP